MVDKSDKAIAKQFMTKKPILTILFILSNQHRINGTFCYFLLNEIRLGKIVARQARFSHPATAETLHAPDSL